MSAILFFFYCFGHPRHLHVLTHAFPTHPSSYLGEIILGNAIALGREELEEAPAAGPPPRLEPRQWRARDDVERQHLVGVAGGAVDRVEQVRAAVARHVALGAVHVAVEDARDRKSTRLKSSH